MLAEEKRKQLDGIVQKMVANKESEANIKFVVSDFKQKYQNTQSTLTPDKISADTYGAAFPAVTGDSPLSAGLKAAGNLPSSAYTLGKNIYNAVRHPIDTVSGIGNAAIGAVQKGVKATTGFELPQTEGVQKADQTFGALKGALSERYGGLDNLQRTATNDPVGFATDILTILEGGGNLVGKGELVNNAISKVGSTVTKPITKTAETVGSGIYKTGKFAVTKSTGLNADTISEIARNPKAFTREAVAETTRAGVGGEVKTAIDSKIKELSDTGKGYNPIREGSHVVTVDSTQVANVLDGYGIKVVDVPDGAGGVKYKLKTSAESKPLSVGEKTKLEEFLNTYGTEPQYTGNSFLNTREAISNLGGYEQGNTGNLERISRDLRGIYDSAGKEQVPGLRELDEAYAPLKQELKQIKKDYLNKDGSFKDGAVNKIANLTGKGKDQVLARLEEVKPGITQKIKTLKAVEDIQAASGFKVGTYERGAATVAGVMTGNVPLIVASIMAQPEIAVPLIRGYGLARPEVVKVINLLKTNLGEVNNFQIPSSLKDLPVGLSTKSITPELVASKIDARDLGILRDFLAKDDVNSYMRAQHLFEHMAIAGMEEPVLKRFVKEVVDLSTKKLPVKSSFKSTVAIKGDKGLFMGSKKGN